MHRILASIALVATVLAGMASLAGAAEISRAQYVDRAEPICKVNVLANRHIFKGIRGDIRNHRFKLASRKFARASLALTGTVNRLEPLPRPAGDDHRLGRWLSHLRGESELLAKVAEQLLEEHTAHLGRYVLALKHNANVANNIVLKFGFEYCLLQPARYV